MGIPNLLRFLKPFIEPVHIKKYSGKRVGIDAYSWLHKGAYSCSMELCLGSKGDASRRYLKYFMHHINLLRHYNIIPVVVFDGGSMPCKSATDLERHKRREINLALAKEELKAGDITSAVEFFQKAVRITPSMAYQLIKILRSERIEFVVAPYEADAQLAYLSTLDADEGAIEAVITEDSDLIAYGCPIIIYKMDRYGNGEEFVMDRAFNSSRGGLSFNQFNKELFIGMCILAGCDFLPSISGIGTRRAYLLVSKYKNLERVLSALKLDKSYLMPKDYEENFWKAVAGFNHARIYDAKAKSVKPLRPLEKKHEQTLCGDQNMLGPELPAAVATAIAEGRLNPITMETFDNYEESEKCSKISFKESWIHYICADNDQFLLQRTHSSEAVYTEKEGINENHKDFIFDQEKYMRESAALGKLIAPPKLHQLVDKEAGRSDLPNNNPFKRRKIENHSQNEQERSMNFCRESVQINSESISEVKAHTKGKTSKGGGILRFFQRL